MLKRPDISKFHYLTQEIPEISHVALAEIACSYGIRWVQLRVKEKSYQDWLEIARATKQVCDDYDAVLIINDSVEIAKEVNAHGVHLGKQDMSVEQARSLLGINKIIGATANTLEDIEYLETMRVDYIGLGPFRFTTTKKNLASVIGFSGYEYIAKQYHGDIPIIAIGGVGLEDIKPLLITGVYGVAVSSAVNLSTNKQEDIAQFLNSII